MIVHTHHSFFDKQSLPTKPKLKPNPTSIPKSTPKSKPTISGLALEMKRARKNERRRKWYAEHKDELKIRRLRKEVFK